MVVQREMKFQPEIVSTYDAKGADIIHNSPLFDPLQFQRHCSSDQLQDIFRKLQEAVETLPASLPSMKSTLSSNSLNLRLRAVTVIRCLHLFFGGTSDVFATSVGVLDKFMSMVRIQERYLSCCAAACFFISTKLHLEEEEIPAASELAGLHGNKWTSSDLCRMEAVILKKLCWNVPKTTYLTFLRLFEKVFSQIFDDTMSGCLEGQICMAESLSRLEESTMFQPSTLAFCVLSHFMEKQEVTDSRTRTVLIQLQLICDIHDSELLECKDLLCQSTERKDSTRSRPYHGSNNFPFKIRSRPSSEGESELPPITEVTSY